MKTLAYLLALAVICISSNLFVSGQLKLRSVESMQRVLVRFWNQSNRRVSVIWVDFNGNYQTYRTLGRNEMYDAYTYVTHPWVFQDADNGESLLPNRQAVFYPTVRSRSDSSAQVVLTEANEYRTLVSITECNSCCANCAAKTTCPIQFN